MRNIIITGGGLVNKGAQAMTLITVDAVRRRFPDHQIYLYSETDRQRPQAEREQYAFRFTGWYPMKYAKAQHNPLLRSVCLLRSGRDLRQAEEIYRNADLLLDISGYAVGSNWSDKIIHDFLDILEFAHAFGVPTVLLPQSFGPFDFGPDRAEVDRRIGQVLGKVKTIFAREQEGYDALRSRYGLTNVELARDMVLCSKEIDLDRVFRRPPVPELPTIPQRSVCIIPNSRNSQVGGEQAVYDLYDRLIGRLREMGRPVFLLCHSTMDEEYCRTIKSRWAEDDGVTYLSRDFSCVEFNELVCKFDYLIASRFHSIVHAFKNGVPCIALGWATKYRDLLELFGQGRYLFDVRAGTEQERMLAALEELDRCAAMERGRILEKLKEVQREDVFARLFDGQE